MLNLYIKLIALYHFIKKRTYIKRCVQFIIIGVIFFFLGKNIYINWLKVGTYEWHINYALLIISFVMLIFMQIIMITIWQIILKRMGAPLSFRKAFKIWFICVLGRYIPGKIWQVVGMVYLTSKEDIPVETSITSVFLAQVLSLIPGLIFGLSTIILCFPEFPKWIYLSLLIVPLGILVAHPPYLEYLINIISSKLGRPKIHINATFRNNIVTMLLYFLNWVFFGIVFFLFTSSITDIPLSNLLPLSGIFVGSYILGLLAIFVPGGLGVRESILATLLSTYFPFPIAITISLAARIWITLSEVVCVLIALKLK